MTMQELSAKLGISTTTLWRALKDPMSVKESTRNLIEAYMSRDRGFIVESYRAEICNLIIPNFKSPLYTKFISAIMEKFQAEDITLQLHFSNYDTNQEGLIFKKIKEEKNTSVIWFTFGDSARKLLSQKPNFPCLIVSDSPLTEAQYIPQVFIKYQSLLEQAVHLLRQHKNFAPIFFDDSPTSPIAKERQLAIKRVLSALGIPPDSLVSLHSHEATADYAQHNIHHLMRTIIKNKNVDSIIVGQSFLVPSVLQALEIENLIIAKDIRLVALDYENTMDLNLYPITTVSFPMGNLVSKVVDVIQNWSPYHINIPPSYELSPSIYLTGTEDPSKTLSYKKKFLL